MVELQNSREAEVSVLGTLMVEPSGFSRVYAIIKDDDFFFPDTKKVFSTMYSLFVRGIEINVQTVLNHFKVEGYEGISEFELRDFLDYRVSVETAISFSVQIAEFSGWRSLKFGLEKLNEEVNSGKYSLTDVSQKISSIASTISSKGLKDDIVHGSSMLEEYLEMLDRPKDLYAFSGIKSIDFNIYDFNPKELSFVAARPGVGKALPMNAPILTPRGWVENKDLRVGDYVVGSSGGPCKVLGVYPQGERESYKVSFSDGTFAICDLDHLWETSTRKERKNKYPASVKTTKEIMETLRVNKDNRLNHSIKYTAPVEFSYQPITLDPYLLGLYLGDGCYKNNPVITSGDEEIIKYLEDNYEGTVFLRDNLFNFRFNVRFANQLIEMGLGDKKSFDKFIPENYIYNTIGVRHSLLQGLLDTDGHVNKTTIEYSTVSERLMEGVVEIVRSLGGKTRVSERMGSYTKNGIKTETRKNYRVFISFPDNGINPFKLARKSEQFNPVFRFSHKFITNVEPCGRSEEMQCIAVDSPDNLFVTYGYNLTHNTTFMLQSAISNARKGNRVGFLSMEMERSKLFNRLVSHRSRISGTRISRMNSQEFSSNSKLVSAAEEIGNLPIFIDDTGPWTSEAVPKKIRKLFYEYNCNLIYVDYIGLIVGSGELASAPRNQQLTRISADLKSLASELAIPILAASQLNRDVEKRSTSRPMLADLRDSGSLEQDASIVAFLYPNVSQADDSMSLLENENEMPVILEIAKQRNGPVNQFELVLNKKFGLFESLEEKNATY